MQIIAPIDLRAESDPNLSHVVIKANLPTHQKDTIKIFTYKDDCNILDCNPGL